MHNDTQSQLKVKHPRCGEIAPFPENEDVICVDDDDVLVTAHLHIDRPIREWALYADHAARFVATVDRDSSDE